MDQHPFVRTEDDLNDAIALARLAVSDAELTPIRHKSITEIRIQTVQAVRQQLMSQRSKSIVSFKALAQQWGIPCAAGHRNLKKLRESIEAKVDLITRPVANAICFCWTQSNPSIGKSDN